MALHAKGVAPASAKLLRQVLHKTFLPAFCRQLFCNFSVFPPNPQFMKWTLCHASNGIHHWQLQKDDGLASLSFNRQWLSLRLAGISKRLLFLRIKGFLQKKVFLHTEYGFATGDTAFVEKPSAGQLTLCGQPLVYQTNGDELSFFDEGKNKIAGCTLPQRENLENLEFYSLLFGFAWFLTADGVAEKERAVSVNN